ncbi:MAG: 3-keto-5-aminohexanoate cleavage protein [Candidatus Aminicenantes bacterium]|nr:MAG: 3-keto-5-aminohexanoate cleavage protein [Candidatus Aminicenantes bacterium]
MAGKEWEGFKWAEMVSKQGINPTMDKKLIMTVCPVGATITRRQNPDQPYTPKEIADGAIGAYEEGAAVAHLHTRTETGGFGAPREVLKEVIDLILDKCPDMIIQPSSCESYVPGAAHYSYESVKPLVDLFSGSNRRYMESTIFTPVSYAAETMDGEVELSIATETNTVKTVQYLQDHNIKPEFMNHNWEGIMNVREWLVKPGILQKPYLMSMGPGMHNAAETYPDPWGYMYVLGMIKMMPEDSVIGLSAGGRNWLPLSTFSILMGVDSVRIGMEDHIWMYPHKDEMIKKSADAAKKIATISRELGRDIASPRDARKIMGIP